MYLKASNSFKLPHTTGKASIFSLKILGFFVKASHHFKKASIP
jgi:hypothetical protein